jgi:hypothetical protein
MFNIAMIKNAKSHMGGIMKYLLILLNTVLSFIVTTNLSFGNENNKNLVDSVIKTKIKCLVIDPLFQDLTEDKVSHGK